MALIDILNRRYVQTHPDICLAGELPNNPSLGQQAIIVDSVSAPTYSWAMQYNPASASWIFAGGASFFQQIATGEGTSSTSYTALTTPGPQFTFQRAGTYLMEFGCEFEVNASGGPDQWMTIKRGGAAASDTDAVHNNTHTASTTNTGSRAYTVTPAVGDLYVAQYRVQTFTPGFGNRWLRITPVTLT